MSARRIVLYPLALIGLLITIAGLLALSSGAIRLWSSGPAMTEAGMALAREFAAWIGLGLAGVALWAVCWFPANRAARQLTLAGAAERGSSLRKAYLYVGQLVTLGVGLIEAALMVDALLRRGLELPAGSADPLHGWVLARATGALIALLTWTHLRWVTVHDGDFGREFGRAANWRRAYLYVVALAGFALVVAGAIGYVRSMLGLAAGALLSTFSAGSTPIPVAAAWREPIARSVTELMIGIPVAILIWSTANRLAAGAPVREYGALSRVTLLHAGLLFGAVSSLASVAYLLRQGLLLLRGETAIAGLAWHGLITALACLPASIAAWLAFTSAARHTVKWSREAPRAVSVRRVTFYLLAGAGLTAFWFGLTQLLQVILLGAAGAAVTTSRLSEQLVERFSLGAAAMLVGAPAWWGYWWPRQVRARQAGLQGTDERRATARKAYLYGIIAAASVALALSLSAIVLRGVRVQTTLAAVSANSAGALAGAGIALFWLIAHLLVLRGDRRWGIGERQATSASPGLAAAPTSESWSGDTAFAAGARSFRRDELPALAATAAFALSADTPRPVVVIDGGDGSLGASLAAALHGALPELPVWPMGLNPVAQAAMLASMGGEPPLDLPPDALARARAVVLPSDLLLPEGLDGESGAQLRSGLAASTARLILLPPRDPRLRWVGAPEWPIERWIENAVIEVGNVV